MANEGQGRSVLFTPIDQRGARDGGVVSPVCLYSADDGFVGDWHFVL